MANYPFTPYGRLSNGNYGINVNPLTHEPQVASIEILSSLPATTDTANFHGRTVFETTNKGIYTFIGQPINRWDQLNKISNVDIQALGGYPSSTPAPESGSMVYDITGGVLYLWTGASWVIVGGQFNTVVVRDIYTGDGVNRTFVLNTSGATIDENLIFVDVDGVTQKPFTDYTLVGSAILFGVAPPSGTEVQIRTFENVNANSLPTYENRATVNAASYSPISSDSYIAVKYTTTSNVVIDLSGITNQGSLIAGRKIIIKDEGGNASVNNITILPGTTIDGNPLYTLSLDYDSVNLMFDGSLWYTF